MAAGHEGADREQELNKCNRNVLVTVLSPADSLCDSQ